LSVSEFIFARTEFNGTKSWRIAIGISWVRLEKYTPFLIEGLAFSFVGVKMVFARENNCTKFIGKGCVIGRGE
jgi:hypothetical protein